MSVAIAILGVPAMIAGLVILWRFFTLRSHGYPVLVRSLPAEAGRKWRHGVLLYSGTQAKFYKVRSIWPESDVQLTRIGTSIVDRRQVGGRELRFMEEGVHVVVVETQGRRYEIAVDDQGDTALVAWLESAPSERRVES